MNVKPPQSVRRSYRNDRPMAVPKMATKKRPACLGTSFAIFLMALILVGLLFMLDIIPFPFSSAPMATPTETQSGMLKSVTPPTATPSFTPSHTPKPSRTSTPTETKTPTLTSTNTAIATEKAMPYVIRGTPQAYPNKMLHPQYECKQYLFIGGEVLDLREAPVLGLTVKLGGTYGGDIVDFTSKSGDIKLYGQSGFEFVMDNKLINEDEIFIQLIDDQGEPLSARTFLPVTSSCEGNLIIVNFKQVR